MRVRRYKNLFRAGNAGAALEAVCIHPMRAPVIPTAHPCPAGVFGNAGHN